jgi:Domain of unknown function (DUF4139)
MKDWTDVPLVLETATPTFNKEIPKLDPWTISTNPPIARLAYSAPVALARNSGPKVTAMSADLSSAPTYASPPPPPLPAMSVRGAEVAKGGAGNVSATFSVPGKMSIPSDGSSHNVTIVQLKLDAKMTWVSVPRKDTKVHLSVCLEGFLAVTYCSSALIRPRSRILPNFCCSQGTLVYTSMAASSPALVFLPSLPTSRSIVLLGMSFVGPSGSPLIRIS